MSYQAIGYMTAKHATEMQWLTPEDAQTLGINVVMLDAITNPSPPTTPAASLPEIHIPPLTFRRKAHPDWKPLGSETKELTEVQESCKPYPADQVSLCWRQERDSWDWSVKNREKFPKDKFPEAQAKRFQCWEVAQPGMALRFTTYKNCVIATNVGIDGGFGSGAVNPSCAGIKGDPSLPGGRVNQPQVILIDRPPLDRL